MEGGAALPSANLSSIPELPMSGQSMQIPSPKSLIVAVLLSVFVPTLTLASSIDRFYGTYVGEGDLIAEGESERRNLSTTIAPTKNGFSVTWTSVVYRSDGRHTVKSYTIEFLPSDRENIFGSAMKTNVFGKQIPLDPLQGEPFVWSRLDGDTLSVFSLFIDDVGQYDMQEYHRTLAEGGLDLRFVRLSKGQLQKEIRAFLKREE
ncbi:MAG: hypothetical protein WBB25_09260 [Sulfitobacter sp.]